MSRIDPSDEPLFRIMVVRPQKKKRGDFQRYTHSIYEECESNVRCLEETNEIMADPKNHRQGVQIHIQEFYDDDWNTVLAYDWIGGEQQWKAAVLKVLRRRMARTSSETAKVRVALVLPGERHVLIQDCGESERDCFDALADLRNAREARVEGAQLHVQVRLHGIGAWGSSRYEEFRRGRWQFVAMPSELVYLRNRRRTR
jgi:hypothetical protein